MASRHDALARAALAEIAGHEQKIRELEDGELTLWEQVEAAKKERSAAEKLLDAAKARAQAAVKDLETRAGAGEQQLQKLLAERLELSKQVAPDRFRLYERLLARLTPTTFRHVVAPLDQNSCGSCHLKMPPAVRQSVLRKELVTCQNCGAILYHDA